MRGEFGFSGLPARSQQGVMGLDENPVHGKLQKLPDQHLGAGPRLLRSCELKDHLFDCAYDEYEVRRVSQGRTRFMEIPRFNERCIIPAACA